MWSTFFDAEQILLELGLTGSVGCAVDFGCGYGTFTIPAARVISGSVHAFDLDPVMIEATRQKVESLGLTNICAILWERDRDWNRERSIM